MDLFIGRLGCPLYNLGDACQKRQEVIGFKFDTL
jgi:hypothetical protein